MNLIEKIQEEKNRVAKEVEKLQSQNAADLKKMESLKEDYIYSTDANDIDIVNAQIKDLAEAIRMRKEKIAYLQTNDPKIEGLYVEQLKQWINEKNDLEEQSEKLFEKLNEHRQALIDGLNQLAESSYRIFLLKDRIKSGSANIKDGEFKKFAFKEGDRDNKTARIINSMFVERKDVRWKK